MGRNEDSLLRAAGETTLASAPRGGSCAHPDQSRGLARRRHLRAISGVGASSALLLFFLGGGVALHERLVSECPNCPVPHQAALRLHLVQQEQTESHDHIAILPRHSIELLTLGQARERCSQAAQRIAVESALAGKLRPLSKHCQGEHLATRQRGGWTRAVFLMEPFGLAKVIDHHVQCRKSRYLGQPSASSFSL